MLDNKFKYLVNYINSNLIEKKLRECPNREKDINKNYYNYMPVHETYKKWILQIDLHYFKYKEKIFCIGFQYQDETCKLNCGKIPYNTSKPNEINNFIDIFYKNAPIDYRINLPKTRAYVSMSKKYKGIDNLSDEEFSKIVFSKLIEIINITNKLKNIFNQNGCEFF